MRDLLERTNTGLIDKYDIYAYDYIEYPHKSFWSEKYSEEDYKASLRELFASEENPPLVLYLHIPYCEQLCWFCVCRLEITHNYDRVKNYLKFLYQEIDLLRVFFEENSITPNFKEVHLGGGSPTHLREEEFCELKAKIQSIVDFKNLIEFTIEIDPRRVNRERMKFYCEQPQKFEKVLRVSTLISFVAYLDKRESLFEKRLTGSFIFHLTASPFVSCITQ